ncbi:hypothetical protein [Streptomyces rimosus]|uniref:hypothetical protein n=1 Tax=Streptomyces rimosus TaxID=1927 RepID=UPI00379BFE13
MPEPRALPGRPKVCSFAAASQQVLSIATSRSPRRHVPGVVSSAMDGLREQRPQRLGSQPTPGPEQQGLG